VATSTTKAGTGRSGADDATPAHERVAELPELLVQRTTAKSRRALNFWLFVVWLVPGTAVWIWLRDELWFVGFMSIYAIWVTHWSGFSAETPVEDEQVSRGGRRRST